jgi:hypothetical protein
MERSVKLLAYAIAIVGLTWLGFEYESGWPFVGAVLIFLEM